MLAQPLSDHDQGGRGLTCMTLPPGLPLADSVSDMPTGLSFPAPHPPSTSSSSSRSFFPVTPSSSTPLAPILRSPPSLNFLTSTPAPQPLLPAPSLPLSISSSTPYMSLPPVATSHPSSSSSHSPPLISSNYPSSVFLSPSHHPSPLAPVLLSSTSFPHSSSSSSPLLHPSLHTSPPTVPPSLFPSMPPLLTLPHVCSASLPLRFYCPPPPPISSVSSPSPLAFATPSPTSPLSPSPPHTSVFPPISPTLHPPPPPPVCCPCSSLLPRLLSAHRLEVRRLLRGALASLGRRLDSLERRTRKKGMKRRSTQGGESLAAFRSSCSHSPTPTPAVASSSSSSSSSDENSSTLALSPSFSQSEQKSISTGQEEFIVRKRRRKNCSHEYKEEEDAGRFVEQMRGAYRGGSGEDEVLLSLHDFNHKRSEQGRISQSQKAFTVVRQNGYSISDLSSQHALHLLQSVQSGWTSNQSEAFCASFSQWHFSDFTPPGSLSPNQIFSRLWLCSSSFSSASILLLSAVSTETVSEFMWSGGSPQWPLKDLTAPPSLSIDHCYGRPPTSSLNFSARRQQKQRANHITQRLHKQRSLPPPSCSANGLSPLVPADHLASGPKFINTDAECSKRVSLIRIRRATPRETLLTPMGLPKVKRLKKKEFSLEEIYTNKNYKSPTTNRSLETIFEEPREKDGVLLLIGQQRRRRLLLFPDFTQPRKRKRAQGAGVPVSMVPRKRVARRHCHGDSTGDDDIDLDVMLVERLSALEDFMTQQGLDV
ncbi:uncharacterized protein wu:fi75a02 [Anabas testudineus]|uniref:Tantalus-like domain-containing protein n=1 Tax=Anabas testudineus TaxID=64144 RepID=A0A7N6AQX3_ANATE|nr:uncharacterized protein wu:fi75a02 [Anabas testudineus]